MAPVPPAPSSLAEITDWVFDLDNTLYPRTCDLFAQIDVLITTYVMNVTGLDNEAARALQYELYKVHGTTLNGLMHTHDIDPGHYLQFVHDIDYSSVVPDPGLVAAIAALPGRKFIFTNADNKHAEAVLGRLGAADLFDGLFDIHQSGYRPKPEPAAYESFLTRFTISPSGAIMFDDLQKNLLVPHRMGMRTVHVVPDADFSHDQVASWEIARDEGHPHIHHITSDLTGFLNAL